MIHAVEKVCTYLPSSWSSQCKDLVETYGEAIIELLVQQADPKTVCTVLALCREARHAYVGKFEGFIFLHSTLVLFDLTTSIKIHMESPCATLRVVFNIINDKAGLFPAFEFWFGFFPLSCTGEVAL